MNKYWIKDKLKRHIIYPIWRFLNNHVVKYSFYQNINLNLNNQNQKKVLLSYITAPMEYNEKQKIHHTNIHESIQILQILIAQGFCIDLIHCQDNENLALLATKKYDLIIGFGEAFYEACLLNPNSKKVIYLTELSPWFSLSQEKERIQYFYDRHFIKIQVKRSEKFFKSKYIDVADFGILMGNEYTARTYNGNFKRIYLLQPTGLINPDYKFQIRNVQKTKKQFVWFGSSGAVHKGLDILIDVFGKLSDCTLYVCGLNPLERQELSFMKKYDNIVDLGFLDVVSVRFLELVNQCSYVVFPSCSEGMATSVLTCMNHSLVPIVTKETGISVYDFGFEIEDYHVESVMQIVKKASNLDEQELQKMHEKAFSYASTTFNLEHFTKSFTKIIDDILKVR